MIKSLINLVINELISPHFRYIEEHVQKTGVAIETHGIYFVTSGRKRDTLTVSEAGKGVRIEPRVFARFESVSNRILQDSNRIL